MEEAQVIAAELIARLQQLDPDDVLEIFDSGAGKGELARYDGFDWVPVWDATE